ncbi:hypothetical protein [Chromobacterium haemolyticum]|uniref:hypothetical protein n=1 Tax=Chromobacterium haemolyticum TaxID=394935 RepID=UPI001177B005|nr:hypothetical protein [Chromobacterium haemolyticum]
MPFYAPWKTKFTDGDLVYGLHEIRHEYAIGNSGFRGTDTRCNISTIDQYAGTKTERTAYKQRKSSPLYQESFNIAILNHAKYKCIFEEFGFIMDGNTPIDDLKNIGRKIKAGLHWASTDGRHFTAHFILDGLNIMQVIQKSHQLDRDGSKSLTGVELRWIYRNRHKSNVRRAVQFWIKGEPCLPPWEPGFMRYGICDPKEWLKYVPSHEDIDE